jgi:alkanesulfonate monooxygenase SsuD/methylene tetrahydromethanopterin reductase-like flavin-dependent oxidoreductase (luciferase family)
MRPFRFGIIAENARTAESLLDTSRRAESAGYSTLLLRDHIVEGPFPHQLAPLTALAAVAMATTRLRIGTLVLANDFRHPSQLAKEIATLDVLSGGRVEPGLGAGFLRRDYEEAGLPLDPPGDRVGRLEESLQVLKGLFGEAPLTHRGRHYRFTGHGGSAARSGELGGHHHKRGRRLGDTVPVAHAVDPRARVHQRAADPVHATHHADPLADAQRSPVAHLQAAGEARVAGVPPGPSDRLVQHQRHHPAVDHATPALVPMGHLELADRALAGGLEAHLHAVVVPLSAAEAAAVVGHLHAV